MLKRRIISSLHWGKIRRNNSGSWSKDHSNQNYVRLAEDEADNLTDPHSHVNTATNIIKQNKHTKSIKNRGFISFSLISRLGFIQGLKAKIISVLKDFYIFGIRNLPVIQPE